MNDKAESISDAKRSTTTLDWVRETLESLAVALILAFLFRAFVAEAFVIPTGFMAPTLMGAHKDVVSIESKLPYQSSASSEFNSTTGERTDLAVVGTIDPISRREQPVDLANVPNDVTFPGDRILVSKFSYLWSDPKRWDVIVFKCPDIDKVHVNYIKRCVGLPEETLRVQHGDIYTRPKGSDGDFTIARKPPNVVGAMLQPIYDSENQCELSFLAGVPDAWQISPAPFAGNLAADPESPNSAARADEYKSDRAWKITSKKDDSKLIWNAKVDNKGGGTIEWMRYYHRVLDPIQWSGIISRKSPPVPIHPYSSRLVSDFTAYNGSILTTRSSVFENNGKVSQQYKTDWLPSDINNSAVSTYVRTNDPRDYLAADPYGTDGVHWVPDLAVELKVTGVSISNNSSERARIVIDLVEAGVHYECSLDARDGMARLTATDQSGPLAIFESNKGLLKEAMAKTSFRGNGSSTLKFANVDNVLTLWVNGRAVEFFDDANKILTDSDELLKVHRPTFSSTDAGDASPIGVGVEGMSLELSHLRAWRDIYYIAKGRNDYGGIHDYRNFEDELRRSVPADRLEKYLNDVHGPSDERFYIGAQAASRDALFSSPDLWANSRVFDARRRSEFRLDKDEFFPMGDNSAASYDARMWNSGFVPRRLLVGRAIMVFWPHRWAQPPLPNFARMGLIR